MNKNKKVKYTDEPIQLGNRIRDDFLPKPHELVFKNVPQKETEKVHIDLSADQAAFLKQKAKQRKISYKSMIESILKYYIAQERSA